MILVCGGTGFLGSHIVERILRDGRDVRILSRDPSRHEGRFRRPGVSWAAGDVTEPSSLQRAFTGVTTVIHAVQFPTHPVEIPARGWTYRRVDAEGTQAAVAMARKTGVRRFIYLSGAGTDPSRPEPWFRAKARAEEVVRESGLEHVILRPSLVYGPGDRTLNRLASTVRYLPFVPVIGSGMEKVQPVFVGDLSEVTARAIDLDPPDGPLFEVGGPEQLTVREVVRTVLEVLGKRRAVVGIPKGLVKVAASFLALLPVPPLSPAAVDFVTMDVTVDIGPMRRTFGIEPAPLGRALRRYLGRPSGNAENLSR